MTETDPAPPPPTRLVKARAGRPLLASLLVYLVLYALAFSAHRERLNGDAICYLQNAHYLTEGRLMDSVSGYWSPLLSWSIAPFLLAGLDGVHAAHLVMGLWGALLIAAAGLLLRQFTSLSPPWDTLLMILLAINVVNWSAQLVTPDIALAATLLLYCGWTLSPGLLHNRRTQFIAGLLGGTTYLAKSYGLPFFCAQFTFVIALRFWLERKTAPLPHALRAWAVGVAGFAVVAGPWIGALSVKEGHLTFSTVARIAHTIVGPPDESRRHPNDSLWTPPEGRLTIWETPNVLPYNHWSPLENTAYLKHQVQVVLNNAAETFNALNSFDLLRLFPGALLLLPILLRVVQRQPLLFHTLWFWGVTFIFAGGFLPVYFEPRYVVPFLWPLCTLFFFDLVIRHGRQSGEQSPKRSARAWIIGLNLALLVSFATPALYELQSSLRNPSTNTWRLLAERLGELDCKGPVASSPGAKTECMITAYHASTPFLGPVKASSTLETETQLAAHNAQTFLVREARWDLGERFINETSWTLKETFKHDGLTIHIFVPPAQP